MRHLTPDTFIDVLDGTVAESEIPHLRACDACRQRLAGLRETWQAAVAADVPEPSPLFWEHLSARVRADVAQESERHATAGEGWNAGARSSAWWWRFAGLTTAAVAGLVLMGVLQTGPEVQDSRSRIGEHASPGALPESREIEPIRLQGDDESLQFVADLAEGLDLESAAEAGFASRDAADLALADLTDSERVELERLLNDALGSGA